MALPDNINPNNFPAKLWRLVNSVSNGAIYWDISGDIVVVDQRLLETQVLSPLWSSAHNINAFKTSNFSSFVRQLNLYGFRKAEKGAAVCRIRTNNDPGSVHLFHNPNFRRNHPDLLVNLRRLTAGNKAKMEAGLEVCCRRASRIFRDTPEKNNDTSALGAPVMHHVLTPAPPRYLVRGHGVVAFLTHRGVAASLNHPYTGAVSSPFHQATPPNNQAFHPQNAKLAFLSPGSQCYRPVFSSAQVPVGGHHLEPLPPTGRLKMNCDVNLDTVFKIADEMMETPVTLQLVKVQSPDKHTQNGPRMMMSQGGADHDAEDAGVLVMVNSDDFLTRSEEDQSVVHVPKQLPEDAICEMDSNGEWTLEVMKDEEEEDEEEQKEAVV